MRPLLALVVVVAVLGGLQLYMVNRPEGTTQVQRISDHWATGRFDIEITLTFDAGADPFSLSDSNAPSLLVLFRGQEILRHTEKISAGQRLVIPNVENVETGINRFFIKAVPENQALDASLAARIRVLRDDALLAENTLWSEPGLPVDGEVMVHVDESHQDHGHHHGEDL